MNIKISYSKEAEKFLIRNQNVINEKQVDDLLVTAAKVVLFKEDLNIDLKKMKGEKTNYFRIRKGKTRILFTIIRNHFIILNVEYIGFRGRVY